MLDAIRQAKASGFGLVVFTGGEATMTGEHLLAAIRETHRQGLLSRLVTNCHWASSEEAAEAYMSVLRECGLSEINFSTGDQHARFVDLDFVLMAVRSALKLDYSPALMVETVAERAITRDTIVAHPYHRETCTMYPGRLMKISESPWMPLKPKRLAEYPTGVAIDRENLESCQGCDSVLGTLTLQADGKLGACCGLGMRLIPELNVGNIEETSLAAAVQDGEEDLLKRWIRLEGPERILEWAAGIDASIEWEGQYAHRCQACLRLYKDPDVRRVIREHYEEKIPDILFGEWLLHDYGGGDRR